MYTEQDERCQEANHYDGEKGISAQPICFPSAGCRYRFNNADIGPWGWASCPGLTSNDR